MNELLRAENIKKRYIDGTRTLEVLHGINLSVNRGETIAVTGPSGAGKSTLLHILGGLDRPSEGAVFYNNTDLNGFSNSELAEYRNTKVGFVFQFHHLLPEFSALENVFLPSLISGKKQNDVSTKAKELLRQLGLAERLTHLPSQLSGGEQQRVAIARALMNDPDVLLADEPTGNLDAKTADSVINDLIKTMKERQKTFIIVTHEHFIAEMMDKIYDLKNGQLVLEKENNK